MYKTKHRGKNNLCGENIARLRKARKPKTSQRALADELQLLGIEIDKNAISRIEAGERFVTDIELRAFADFFNINIDELQK